MSFWKSLFGGGGASESDAKASAESLPTVVPPITPEFTGKASNACYITYDRNPLRREPTEGESTDHIDHIDHAS